MAVFLGFIVVFSMHSLLAAETFNGCKLDKKDVFEPLGAMLLGKHAGECLDTEHDRGYRILSKDELSKIPKLKKIDFSSHYFIANFKHKNQFWTAVFPKKDLIKNYYYQINRVPPRWLAAHVELRINFNENKKIMLFSQNSEKIEELQSHSMTLSNTALKLRDGPAYDLYVATQDLFAIVRGMQSTEQTLSDALHVGNDIDQYVLSIGSQKNGEDLWDVMLGFFHDPNSSSIYNTLSNNCSTSLFDLIDHFFKFNFPGNVEKAETTVPVLNLSALKRRGLITDSSQQKSIRQEFGYNPIY